MKIETLIISKNWIKVEDEAQASALHQLSEIDVYDFWTEVSKIIWGILGVFQSS